MPATLPVFAALLALHVPCVVSDVSGGSPRSDRQGRAPAASC